MATEQAPANYLPRKKAGAYIGERVRGRPYSEITLIGWERDGRGPPVTRIGRDVVYFIPSIEKWMRDQEQSVPGRRQSASAA
ncbi:hypothetical protein [Bradyrhizobium cytisi]|uniref:DNA-binding protein n=1 Tax=Bradyrhizobium cytisi TaxID=515489 RepID=A0A5S4WPV7_9BRAD|nr:hypothetical protein [Bradyrhizobium cytisi]TYL83612.1 hypothetical protein FXB38_18120 [Bradyrhizobium cytisi]